MCNKMEGNVFSYMYYICKNWLFLYGARRYFNPNCPHNSTMFEFVALYPIFRTAHFCDQYIGENCLELQYLEVQNKKIQATVI